MTAALATIRPCPMIAPYALMDLDDTLFQTQRKIEAWQLPTQGLVTATVNKQGEPLSFFTKKQAQFFAWLQHSTELIPVTARDTAEILRVKLVFSSWQVLSHGAVILTPHGQPLTTWQQQMRTRLLPAQPPLQQIIAWLTRQQQEDWLVTPHYDYFGEDKLMIYVAVKHRHKSSQALTQLAASISNEFKDFNHHFYTHVNANNLAILPHVVDKKHAVHWLQLHHLDPQRASFGFGDSLADLGFLQQLDWYGTPKRGQLHDTISEAIL